MVKSLNILIVEKLGSLKSLCVKDFKENDLYKKCGFKKEEGFKRQVEWKLKMDGNKYYVHVYAKTDGRANSENKYDFPPPIDTKLFYGNCAIVAQMKSKDNNQEYIDISVSLWDKIYEKLFGGFEDLNTTAKEDEEEEDELDDIPEEEKTKHGYLKDGFVVDSSETSDDDDDDDDSMSSNVTTSVSGVENVENKIEIDDNIVMEIDDSDMELTEESYDYDETK
jgi:hypothetical protein